MRDRFKIHNAPDTIWLVYGDIEQDCNHGDCDEVTWCTAPQYEADIEYIRASEVAGDKAELAALRVEIERLQAENKRLRALIWNLRPYVYGLERITEIDAEIKEKS